MLQIAERGSLVLQIVHFPFSMPVVYQLHPLNVLADATQLRILDLKVGKGHQVIKKYTAIALSGVFQC